MEEYIPINTGKICKYKICSCYPEEDVGYNWLNYSYPFVHQHDHWEILVITQGTVFNKVNGNNLKMTRGDVCIMRPNDTHSVIIANDFPKSKHLSFLLTETYMKQAFACYSETLYDIISQSKHRLSFSLDGNELQDIIERILNINSIEIKLSDKILQLKCIVQQLLNTLVKLTFTVNQNFPNWLTDFLFILNNPYIDMTDVKILAKNTPYSYSRLSSIFKNLTGRTIIEYITKTKMKCANELLKSSDMSILEISTSLNYESLSHFIRTFKKEYNITPSEFRKNNHLPI